MLLKQTVKALKPSLQPKEKLNLCTNPFNWVEINLWLKLT